MRKIGSAFNFLILIVFLTLAISLAGRMRNTIQISCKTNKSGTSCAVAKINFWGLNSERIEAQNIRSIYREEYRACGIGCHDEARYAFETEGGRVWAIDGGDFESSKDVEPLISRVESLLRNSEMGEYSQSFKNDKGGIVGYAFLFVFVVFALQSFFEHRSKKK
jgi:hypothetical protein